MPGSCAAATRSADFAQLLRPGAGGAAKVGPMKPVLQLLVPSFVLPLAASFALAGVAGCDDDGAHPLPGCDGGVAGLPADLGAGPADQATAPAPPDAAAAQCMPLRPGRRFTIVAVPDTQYLFDGDRGNADVLAASLHWVVDHACEYNIVFVAGLGDIVENAGAGEL